MTRYLIKVVKPAELWSYERWAQTVTGKSFRSICILICCVSEISACKPAKHNIKTECFTVSLHIMLFWYIWCDFPECGRKFLLQTGYSSRSCPSSPSL